MPITLATRPTAPKTRTGVVAISAGSKSRLTPSMRTYVPTANSAAACSVAPRTSARR